MKRLLALLLAASPQAAALGGTVITANLPANTAIVNIDARADGAASYNGDQSLWYQPFNSGSALPQLTLPAGTYQFRVINPADAASLYPALTLVQTNQIYTAWTFNSPWVEDYLVYDSSALTNSSVPQLFDGAPPASFFGSPLQAYNDALTNSYYNGNVGTNGYYNILRTGPLGRASTIFTNRYTFTNAATLVFVIPDYGLGDNNGGVSVLVTLITPLGGTLIATNLLINPGAETGSLAYWTAGGDSSVSVDSGTFDPGINPRTGNFDFKGGRGSFGSLAQVVSLVGQQGITAGSIDGGGLLAGLSFWEQGLFQPSGTSDAAFVSLAFWDSASNVISTVSTPQVDSHDGTWVNYATNCPVPAGTRYLQYTMNFIRHTGSDLDSFLDDNSLVIYSIYSTPNGTTINANNKYAYAANFGWMDWRGDTNNGAVIGEYVCSGYIYSANFGWINLGGGSPANGAFYSNVTSNDFGLNNDGAGNLRGYAYGANIGWVNFEDNGAPKVDMNTGKLSGYAWSANWGWISLSNSFARVQTDTLQQGVLASNGIPIAWLLSHFGTTNIDASADSDHDGMSNLQEYLAGTDPNDANSKLVITAQSFGAGGTNASLTWNSITSRSYHLQKAIDLNSGSWIDSGLGLIPPAGSTTTGSFTDTNAPMRFYRVQAVQPLVQ